MGFAEGCSHWQCDCPRKPMPPHPELWATSATISGGGVVLRVCLRMMKVSNAAIPFQSDWIKYSQCDKRLSVLLSNTPVVLLAAIPFHPQYTLNAILPISTWSRMIIIHPAEIPGRKYAREISRAPLVCILDAQKVATRGTNAKGVDVASHDALSAVAHPKQASTVPSAVPSSARTIRCLFPLASTVVVTLVMTGMFLSRRIRWNLRCTARPCDSI